MSVKNNIVVVTTTINYLDCIDSRAADISTINQVLHICIKIKDSLKLLPIVCVFDEAIYAKAVQKDTKTPGGPIGFDANSNSIIRWIINAKYRAELCKKMHEFPSYKKQ